MQCIDVRNVSTSLQINARLVKCKEKHVNEQCSESFSYSNKIKNLSKSVLPKLSKYIMIWNYTWSISFTFFLTVMKRISNLFEYLYLPPQKKIKSNQQIIKSKP